MVEYVQHEDARGFTEFLFERELTEGECEEMEVLFEGVGRLDWRDDQTLWVWTERRREKVVTATVQEVVVSANPEKLGFLGKLVVKAQKFWAKL